MSPKPIKEPQHRWRTLPSHGRAAYADTEDEIITKARSQAQELGTSVGYELWSEDHPQDHLNLGWALAGSVAYQPPRTCPGCGHAFHDALPFCPNMASDNDCSCKRGTLGALPMHEFVVTISGCSREEAERVLDERLSPEGDLGLPEIGWRKA